MKIEPQWNRDYLLGIAVCCLSGAGECEMKGPYLIIGADDEQDAEDEYNGRVPLTSYYPCQVLAVREQGKSWTVTDDLLTKSELRQILDSGEARRVR